MSKISKIQFHADALAFTYSLWLEKNPSLIHSILKSFPDTLNSKKFFLDQITKEYKYSSLWRHFYKWTCKDSRKITHFFYLVGNLKILQWIKTWSGDICDLNKQVLLTATEDTKLWSVMIIHFLKGHVASRNLKIEFWIDFFMSSMIPTPEKADN